MIFSEIFRNCCHEGLLVQRRSSFYDGGLAKYPKKVDEICKKYWNYGNKMDF
jgi:hypothetical protein